MKHKESHWLDTNRLTIISKKAVMECRHHNPNTGGQVLPMQKVGFKILKEGGYHK